MRSLLVPTPVRKPKQSAVSQPGDLVEVDTMDVRLVPGRVFKQFTARDLVSRWDVVQAHGRATAASATDFLDTLANACLFPSVSCKSMAAPSSPPSSSKPFSNAGCICSCCPRVLPSSTDRSSAPTATHTEEFYQVTPYSLELRRLNRELRHWERIYNTVRPHQALGYLTPYKFLQQLSSQRKD